MKKMALAMVQPKGFPDPLQVGGGREEEGYRNRGEKGAGGRTRLMTHEKKCDSL